MAWQGIPFRVPIDVNDYISVALNSIPKITIESPTDYWGVALTAGAALVGGIIPAWIAKRTFRENAALLKSEREEQQIFLTTERKRQQEFLIEERLEHSKSLEADRQTQILIAERNFNMQVLSANRQAWICTLRDLLAEYAVQASSKFEAQNNSNKKENDICLMMMIRIFLLKKEVSQRKSFMWQFTKWIWKDKNWIYY